MVVVGIAIALVDGYVDFVGAFDKVKAADGKRRFGVTIDPFGLNLLDVGIGSIAAQDISIEKPDDEHTNVNRLLRLNLDHDRHRLAGVKDMSGGVVGTEKLDVRDFDFS